MNRIFTEPTPLHIDVLLLGVLAWFLWATISNLFSMHPILFCLIYFFVAFTILKIRNRRREFVAFEGSELTAKGHSSEYTYTTMKEIRIPLSDVTFWSGKLNDMPDHIKVRYLPNRRWSAKSFLWIKENDTNDWLMLRRIGFHQHYDELVELLHSTNETKDPTSRNVKA